MTKTIWTGTFGAIVGAATIAALAQAPTPQQSSTQSSTPSAQSSSPSSSTSSERKITVTGCLQAAPPEATDQATTAGTAGTSGTAGAAGTTGTAGAASAANEKFVLADAKLTPASGDQAAGSANQSGAGSASGSASGSSASAAGAASDASQPAQTYRLMANPAALSPHVGKKLELTGTLVDDHSSAGGSANQAGAAAQGPMLRVEAGKVLASSCQQ